VMWELAHRPADSTDSVRVVLEADTSAAAIDQLRAQIPADLICAVIGDVA
jgi:hypothetical protein